MPVHDFEVKELMIFADNDENLYQQMIVPIQKNLMRKKAAGVYKHELAVKLWKYLADEAARRYDKDGLRIFSPDVRREAAKLMAEAFEINAKAGEFDEFIPKKYRKGFGSDDVEDEPEEPEEGDLVTGDYKNVFQVGGKKVLTTSPEAFNKDVQDWMDANKFFPNVWSESDHGNYVLVDISDASAFDTLVSRAFDAGNYANAYVSENLNTAWKSKEASGIPPAFRDAFVLGFYASYELDEIPGSHVDEFIEAQESKVGKAVLAAGYTERKEG